MSALILDGRAFAERIRRELAEEATMRQAAWGYAPMLAIVVLRDVITTPPSPRDVYVRQLRRTARSVGIATRLVDLPTATTAAELLAALAKLNADPVVHGIIVQLPLPPHIGREHLIDAIDPAKDVDGISAFNAGSLFLNQPAQVPATCAAVMELLDRAAIELDGQRVIVVGASTLVGRPLALMLLHRSATVTVCHEYTHELESYTRLADVLVVAVGKPGLITAPMVRPGAVVVDVGINVLPDGNVIGDVDFTGVQAIAGAITPVPGGIGPLTNLMVLRQTLRAREDSHERT